MAVEYTETEILLGQAMKARTVAIRLEYQLQIDRAIKEQMYTYQERARILIDAGMKISLGAEITDEQVVEARLKLENRDRAELS